MVTNKRRGYEVEREVVKLWQGLGVPCKRILGSGAYKHWGKNLAGDVELNGLLVEVKRRRNGTGFASLYKWLEQDDAKMLICSCLLYTSPSPRDRFLSRMPSSA